MQKVLISRIIFIIESIDVFVIDNDDRFTKALKSKPAPDLQVDISNGIKSFYSGVVDLLLVLANNIDGYVPGTRTNNSKLFLQLSKQTETRDSLISEEVMQKLIHYDTVLKKMDSSNTNIDWETLRPLIEEVHIIWSLIKLKTEQLILKLLKKS